jgi:DUF1680 family protein
MTDHSYATDWPADHATSQPVPLTAIDARGYLGRYVEQNLASVLAALDSALPKGFESVAAGVPAPPETDRLAADSDLYKWLEGACYVYTRTPDATLRTEIDRIAGLILAVQRPDGYINTQVPPYERFDPSIRHELYMAGHFCEAAIAHHHATESSDLVDAARRWVDYLLAEHEAGNPYYTTSAMWEHSEYELAFLRLARLTGETKYLDFAITLALELCHVGPKVADIRDGGALHAVRVGYLLAGMADLYLETGRADLAEHLEALWDELVETRMYITGGMASHGEHISKLPFDLPHTQKDPDRTMGETCSSIALILFGWRIHAMTGRCDCFDTIETILYNHLLGSLSLDGLGCFYYNPLRVVGDQTMRTDHWHTPATTRCMLPELNKTSCCMPNFWRFLGALPEYLFSADEAGVFVNLYTESTLDHTLPDGRTVKLDIDTRYPHDGAIAIRFTGDAPTQFTLRLRIPQWCDAPSATLPDGSPADVTPGEYLVLDREWNPGDTVTLEFPMPVRMILPDDRIEANRGQVVFARGPIQYCLETHSRFPVEKVRIPFGPDEVAENVSEEWRPDLLGGIVRLRLTARVNGLPATMGLIPWNVRANTEPDNARWIIFLPLSDEVLETL